MIQVGLQRSGSFSSVSLFTFLIEDDIGGSPAQALQLFSVMARKPYVYVVFWFPMEADAITFNATMSACEKAWFFLS